MNSSFRSNPFPVITAGWKPWLLHRTLSTSSRPIPGANWVFIFLFGGCLGALYTLGNVLMGERFQGGDLAAASTLFATMWNVGALVGPPLGGLGRDLAPDLGLPGALTLIFALFLPVPLVTYLKHRRAKE